MTVRILSSRVLYLPLLPLVLFLLFSPMRAYGQAPSATAGNFAFDVATGIDPSVFSASRYDHYASVGHPRLLFRSADLKQLRSRRSQPGYALIWKNMQDSARWCLAHPLHTSWIAPVTPDPVYSNLYNRFYAIMNDMAIMEHLAFCYAYSGDKRYAEAGKKWALNSARIWIREADGEPDTGKSYAVTRLLKGLAVSYDLLYDQLSDSERQEIRDTMVSVGHKYYQWYVKNPSMGAEGQGPHHATVETMSFGLAGLALLGEVPEASQWTELIVGKVPYLMTHGLTASGASSEGHTFWASTMQYRILFLDALRRVTGQDLFPKYERFMTARKALAGVAGRYKPGAPEDYRTVLFEPDYGQLDYMTPDLVFLAREYRRPIYQYLASWDETKGTMEPSRYVTKEGESMRFSWGGYTYAWYDPSVPAVREPDLPLSFSFPEINEFYARASYESGALVAGQRHSMVQVQAGGRLVFSDEYTLFQQKKPVTDVTVIDDGRTTWISSHGVEDSPFTDQRIELRRPEALAPGVSAPSALTITRVTDKATRFFYYGQARREGSTLIWPDGTKLQIQKGHIETLDPRGFYREWTVGGGVLKLKDLIPMDYYPLVTVQPDGGQIMIEILSGSAATGRMADAR